MSPPAPPSPPGEVATAASPLAAGRVIGLATVYAALAALAMPLAIPPGYASPMFPAAGVALAAALVWGPRVLLGVLIGSAALNLTVTHAMGGLDLRGTLVALAMAFGALAQAAFAAALVRRYVARPLTLSEPRDVAAFIGLGALAACTVSASVATAALWAAGRLSTPALPYHWWTWWMGDTLGTVIAAPVALTLIGRPRREWAFRRWTVGLSLALVGVLLGLAIDQVARWDAQRSRSIFERDATRAGDALAQRLGDVSHAVAALHALYVASDDVSAQEFQLGTGHWLNQPFHLQALGFAQRVPRAAVEPFEAQVRDEGVSGFRVFDRSGSDAAAAAAADREVVVIRRIEPLARNAAALGVNTLSINAARAAVLRTRETGEPAATAGFRLTQETGDQTGVVVYQAVYRGAPRTPAEREAAFQGVVFATLRMEEAVRGQMAGLPAYMRWCLVDTDAAALRRVLAGPQGCQLAHDALTWRRTISLAGRSWQLELSSAPGGVPEVRLWNAWLFSVVGLVAASMLGALLLTVTGRTRRIEVAVAERTSDLRREVGERKRTEAALRESEQRFRNILAHVPIGVIYTDLEGRIREANPRLCRMLGYRMEELAHMTSKEITHPDDRASEDEPVRRLLRGDLPMFRRQKRYLARDGRVVQAQSVTSVLRDASGAPQRLVGVVEDITEHLKLEEAERARERAEHANRAKNEFLSRMSHELRTPLNAMLGFAQLLDLDRQPALAPHQLEWTAQIQQAGWHLLHMINDTLDLSRIESGTLRLSIEPVDLRELVRASRGLLEQSAAKRRIVISDRLDERAQSVLGDPTRIKQVLINLLSNAVKYNVDGGRVHVEARRGDDNMVRIEVSDTGMGMTPQQLAELFQPFNRLGREASTTEGTGIGLVISQRLAELMGGRLEASSAPAEGSTFVLTLPSGAASQATRAVASGEDPLAPTYRQRVVHYIEDNETNAEVMRGILAQRPQIRLDVSANGLDGLAAIRQQPPSLVLLDMHLPDIDGLELLRHLKQDERTADIPVIVVSADATTSRIEETLRLGAAGYLTKPVNVAQILGVLDQQLEPLDTRFG